MFNNVLKYFWPTRIGWFVVIVSLAALITVYTAEFGFGLEPCALCVLQRIPYGLALVLGAAAIYRNGVWRIRLYCLLSLVFLVSAGLAFYHTGVEQHWWASAASCGGSLNAEMTPENLLAALQVQQPKACDDIDWEIFGLSITVYNTALSLLASGVVGLAAKTLNHQLKTGQ